MYFVLEYPVADAVHGLDQPQLRLDILGLHLVLGVAVAGLYHTVG